MEKSELRYENFLFDVPPQQRPSVDLIHDFLSQNGCQTKLEMAKNGYVVSYTHSASKRVLANFVFRKKGLLIRIYGDHSQRYEPFLNALPDGMKAAMAKASACRRLLDPTKCNARCPMGNVYTLDGVEQKKCRYSSFMFLVDAETAPFLRDFLENELRERTA